MQFRLVFVQPMHWGVIIIIMIMIMVMFIIIIIGCLGLSGKSFLLRLWNNVKEKLNKK